MQWDTALKTWSEFSVDLALRTRLDYRVHKVPSNLSDCHCILLTKLYPALFRYSYKLEIRIFENSYTCCKDYFINFYVYRKTSTLHKKVCNSLDFSCVRILSPIQNLQCNFFFKWKDLINICLGKGSASRLQTVVRILVKDDDTTYICNKKPESNTWL